MEIVGWKLEVGVLFLDAFAARPVLFLVVRGANKPSRRVLCAILLFAARTYLRGANCSCYGRYLMFIAVVDGIFMVLIDVKLLLMNIRM